MVNPEGEPQGEPRRSGRLQKQAVALAASPLRRSVRPRGSVRPHGEASGLSGSDGGDEIDEEEYEVGSAPRRSQRVRGRAAPSARPKAAASPRCSQRVRGQVRAQRSFSDSDDDGISDVSSEAPVPRRSQHINRVHAVAPSRTPAATAPHRSQRVRVQGTLVVTDDGLDDEDEESAGEGGRVSNQMAAAVERPVSTSGAAASALAMKIEKLLARRTLSTARWLDVLAKMNTEIVSNGTHLSPILEDTTGNLVALVAPTMGGQLEERFLVKWHGHSHLHLTWERAADLVALQTHAKAMLTRFQSSQQSFDPLADEDDCDVTRFFAADFIQIEKILGIQEHDTGDAEESLLLVKWRGLGYAASTWERVRTLRSCGLADIKVAMDQHLKRRVHRSQTSSGSRSRGIRREELLAALPLELIGESTTVGPGLVLRDYQREGIAWLCYNWNQGRNSILADEMGLGKTVQICVMIMQLVQRFGVGRPFLIVAPLSTLQHWRHELESWTPLRSLVYHGSPADIEMIHQHDLKFDKRLRTIAPQVVVTNYETCLNSAHLKGTHWGGLIVDEAHRLKNHQSKMTVALRDEFTWESTVLMTGTPLQNNTAELWTILNFVDRRGFASLDNFMSEYGDIEQATQVSALQALLRRYMLRRVKSDVLKSLQPKTEVLVNVELTSVQKQYYRAIYEKNAHWLSKHAVGRGAHLSNLHMELRKCCNHPYLIRGAEAHLVATAAAAGVDSASRRLVDLSGKLVFLDKLLPRVKAEGSRVLVFSQFKIMLDILQDYLAEAGYPCERIDGGVVGRERQAAIDRFSAPASPSFVMLLTTRAGGVGINLAAADVVVIYDSDWNPQSDLQAQARAHRLGQTKAVRIYRLLTSKTYEMSMFAAASMKLGVDHAVLASVTQEAGSKAAAAPSAKELEQLLKRGAYDVFGEAGDDGAAAAFVEADLDTILARSATVLDTGGATGGSFSKASFVARDQTHAAVSVDDPDFWSKVVGKGEAAAVESSGNALNPRLARAEARARVGAPYDAEEAEAEEDDGSSAEDSEFRASTPTAAAARRAERPPRELWQTSRLKVFLRLLLNWGFTNVSLELARQEMPHLGTALARLGNDDAMAQQLHTVSAQLILVLLRAAARAAAKQTLVPEVSPLPPPHGGGHDEVTLHSRLPVVRQALEALVPHKMTLLGKRKAEDAAGDRDDVRRRLEEAWAQMPKEIQALAAGMDPDVARKRLQGPLEKLHVLQALLAKSEAEGWQALPPLTAGESKLPEWWSPAHDVTLLRCVQRRGWHCRAASLQAIHEDMATSLALAAQSVEIDVDGHGQAGEGTTAQVQVVPEARALARRINDLLQAAVTPAKVTKPALAKKVAVAKALPKGARAKVGADAAAAKGAAAGAAGAKRARAPRGARRPPRKRPRPPPEDVEEALTALATKRLRKGYGAAEAKRAPKRPKPLEDEAEDLEAVADGSTGPPAKHLRLACKQGGGESKAGACAQRVITDGGAASGWTVALAPNASRPRGQPTRTYRPPDWDRWLTSKDLLVFDAAIRNALEAEGDDLALEYKPGRAADVVSAASAKATGAEARTQRPGATSLVSDGASDDATQETRQVSRGPAIGWLVRGKLTSQKVVLYNFREPGGSRWELGGATQKLASEVVWKALLEERAEIGKRLRAHALLSRASSASSLQPSASPQCDEEEVVTVVDVLDEGIKTFSDETVCLD